jgi:hypothetical protein
MYSNQSAYNYYALTSPKKNKVAKQATALDDQQRVMGFSSYITRGTLNNTDVTLAMN